MVDRKQRDLLADAIHELIIGRITNDDFDSRIGKHGWNPLKSPERWDDAAIGPVVERTWCLYGDSYRYRLVGANRLSRAGRAEVLRWILFLRSDAEYRWPLFRFINPALVSSSGCLLSILTLGFGPRVETNRLYDEWSKHGEFTVWPFLNQAEYEQVYAEFCPLRRVRAA